MSLFRKRNITAQPAPETMGERRQLTVLFYDIVGSTSLAEAGDPERLRARLDQIHIAARVALADHGGSLEQVMGDGGMAYFGYPIPNEDAALSAVQSALALLDARATIPGAPDIRIGIATSVVVLAESPDAMGAARLGAVGEAPNLAARLEAAAPANQILVGPSTYALTNRAMEYQPVDGLGLKGFAGLTRAWRPVALRAVESRFRRDRDSTGPFSGRKPEIAALKTAWNNAMSGSGSAILIEGEPGIGKSRILSELTDHAQDGRTLLLQCQPRTQGEALFAIIRMYDAAYEAAGDPELCDAAVHTAERLSVLEEDDSLSPAARRDAIVAAVAQAFLDLACVRPLLIMAEDLHWADEVTLAVLARLSQEAPRRELLVLVTARPDGVLDEQRDAFQPLPLLPVADDDANALIAALAPDGLSSATRAWIVEKADGNPLFLIELTAHALERGVNDPQADLSGAEVGSLRDLLATRLEHAGPAKRTAQIASVLGREYPYHLLARLTSADSVQALDSDLQRLVDHGLKDVIDNGSSYGFRHALIRDVAYDSQLRAVRRVLHGQVVDLVDSDPALAADVPDILLAEHCLAAERTARGVALLVDVAEDAIRRSALRAPRAMLQRVLSLSEQFESGTARDLVQLRAYALLGPLVTLLEGHRAAAPLYEAGQALYFGLPTRDRSPFFSILWGWWFTSSDLIEQTRRSEILIRDVPPDADAESRLQALHCAWATLFDGGAHDRCLSAISDGLALYDPQTARRSRFQYGHDARVCGLGERALCGWLTGQLETSAEAIRECEVWADGTGHLSSRLHALDIATQVAFFNHDLHSIDRILNKIASLSGSDASPAITAKRQIFRGWMAVRAGDPAQVAAVTQGLNALRDFGVLEDTPLYADIAARVASVNGTATQALGPLDDEIAAARATGLTYWLPELLRRKAMLTGGVVASTSLDEGFEIAGAQNARMLSLRNVATRLDLGLPIPAHVALSMAETLGQVSDCTLRRKVMDALAV